MNYHYHIKIRDVDQATAYLSIVSVRLSSIPNHIGWVLN